MLWTTTDVTNLLLVAKDLGIHLSQSICRKLDLGQSIDQDIEYLYLVINITFALEYGTTDAYEDEDYSYLAEIINRIATTRNRYRGI